MRFMYSTFLKVMLVCLVALVISIQAEDAKSIELIQTIAPSTSLQVADDTPKAVITDMFGNPCPERAELSGVLFFSGGKAVHGGDPASVRWLVFPDSANERTQTFWDKERGPLIVVPIGDKDVTITVIQFVSKGDKGDIAKITVKCGKGDLPPPPKPDPTPEPIPHPDPLPVSSFKGKLTTLTNSFNLSADQKPKVAAAFRYVANNITTIPDNKELLKQTADQMAARLGLNDLLGWIPWRDKMTELVQQQNIPDTKSHAAIWNTVADVLEGK